MKHGTYLGGIRVLEDLRIRCRIDPDTGCWHWGMAISGGLVRVRFVMADGSMQCMNGRRAGLVLRDGTNPPSSVAAFAHPWCRSSDCVNPAHSRFGTRAELGAQLRKRGTLKGVPSKIAANRRTSLSRRLLSDEQLSIILTSDRPGTHLAKEFGCSQQLISEIRRGNRYLSHMKRSSAFSWRPE